MTATDTLDPTLEAHLAGRAVCWHEYLRGEFSLAWCEAASLAFTGYPSREMLLEDYAQMVRMPKGDFDPSCLSERWKAWLNDPSSSEDSARRVLMGLIAFAYTHGVSDVQVVFTDDELPHLHWLANGHTHRVSISKRAGQTLATVGEDTEQRARDGLGDPPFKGLNRAWFLSIQYVSIQGETTLNVRPPHDLSGQPSDRASHLGLAGPFLDVLLAERRAERAMDGAVTADHRCRARP